ncbi:hypothetical protein ACIGXF_36970 [Streptomyces sp. NPDC053086]|uniref:hypothetical protein n=1 Tax=unclassified Streptomyces TaxID=2593676 RepID=UPI0037D50B89
MSSELSGVDLARQALAAAREAAKKNVGADVAGMEEADVLYAEEELGTKRAELVTLASAAIGWGRSDSEVALRARMSRRTVRQLQESADGATAGSQHE